MYYSDFYRYRDEVIDAARGLLKRYSFEDEEYRDEEYCEEYMDTEFYVDVEEDLCKEEYVDVEKYVITWIIWIWKGILVLRIIINDGYRLPPRKYRVKRLMLSEWMVDVPQDLIENWIMVPCPTGKRVRLISGWVICHC